MSLDGLKSLDSNDPSNDDLSSASSSSGDGGYPKFTHRVPYMVIYTENSEYKYRHRPQEERLQILYKRESEHSSWEPHKVPSYIERHWMKQDSFRLAQHMVQTELDLELRSLITSDPEKALKAVKKAAKTYQTETEPTQTETCPICQETIHTVFDDYNTVNGRRVCKGHTISELKSSGLMDRSGMPTNRVWE